MGNSKEIGLVNKKLEVKLIVVVAAGRPTTFLENLSLEMLEFDKEKVGELTKSWKFVGIVRGKISSGKTACC